MLNFNTEETKLDWSAGDGQLISGKGNIGEIYLIFAGGRGRRKGEAERGTKLEQIRMC